MLPHQDAVTGACLSHHAAQKRVDRLGGLPIGLVLKPKIAVIVVSQDAATPEAAIELLDRMLLEAPPDFRKNIFAPDMSSCPPLA